MQRFALYFSPQPETPLAEAAVTWLGRDHINLKRTQIVPETIPPQRLHELTRAPYHYGFHGTLKPPFRLSHDTTVDHLLGALQRFCTPRQPFTIPHLEIATIGKFLCLRPTKEGSKLIHQLANDVVKEFDRFRAPMEPPELEKRRAKGLTARQDELLMQWGYPYVLDEFRFHLTLSSSVADNGDRDLLKQESLHHFPEKLRTAVSVEGLSLFIEEEGAPMTQTHFFRFNG